MSIVSLTQIIGCSFIGSIGNEGGAINLGGSPSGGSKSTRPWAQLSKTPQGKQKVVGAIQVVNRADSADSISAEFTDSEEQLLVTLGEQIVGAVEHCHSKASECINNFQHLPALDCSIICIACAITRRIVSF